MFSGIVFNVIYNILFVLCSYLIHYVLGYTMTPAEYGVIGAIITILDFEYLFLSNGVRQSLAKEISSEQYDIKDVIIKGILFQLIIIIVIFVINYFGAEAFAKLLNDPLLLKYIKFAAFLIPVNGLYIITVGINEGVHRFVSSAFVGVIYTIFKLSVIPYVLYLFNDPVLGTEVGYLTGLIVALIVGIITIVFNKKHFYRNTGKKINFGEYVKNTLNFSVFFIIVSVVLSVDTLIVKANVPDKDMSGFYTGAVNFAKVSYFILSAFFTVMLPTITEKYQKGKKIEATNIIKNVLMIIITFVMPITIIISASAGDLLVSFYSEEYIYAQSTLMVLGWSHFFMGVTVMFNMIIAAVNKKRFSTILAVVTVILDCTLGIIMTRNFGMIGMACTGTICAFVALFVSVKYTSRFFDGMFSKRQLIVMVTNVLLWIFTAILFSNIDITNIFVLGVLYAVIYLGYIILLQILKLINIKEMIVVMKKNRG